MHWVGKSHECFICNKSDQIHHERHQKILELVRELEKIENRKHEETLAAFAEESASASSTSNSSSDTTSMTSDDATTTSQKLKKKDKKLAKKLNAKESYVSHNVNAIPQREVDYVSVALHGKAYDSKGQWATATQQTVIDSYDDDDTSDMLSTPQKPAYRLTPTEKKRSKKPTDETPTPNKYNSNPKSSKREKVQKIDKLHQDILQRLHVKVQPGTSYSYAKTWFS